MGNHCIGVLAKPGVLGDGGQGVSRPTELTGSLLKLGDAKPDTGVEASLGGASEEPD